MRRPLDYTADVPYFQRLIDLLIAAPHRVNASGEIGLTAVEAGMLRASGFPDAAKGKWRLPPVPTHVWIPEYLLRLVPQLVRETPKVAPAPPQPPVAPPRADVEMTPAKRLRWRLGDALRDPDQRRLLTSLAGRPDGPVECRRFQRALHRLKTPRFNAALAALINGGLLQRVTDDRIGCLVLPQEIRRLLSEGHIGVRRVPRTRAKRQRARRGTGAGERAPSGQGNSRRTRALGTSARRRYRPPTITRPPAIPA